MAENLTPPPHHRATPVTIYDAPGSARAMPVTFYDTNGNLVSLGQPGYSVKAYGATGDGVTGDTAAIRLAIAAAAAAGGGDVIVPRGTYMVANSTQYTAALSITTDKVRIRGEDGAVFKATAGSPNGIRMLSISSDDVHVEGVTFDPNGITDATCIFLASCTRTTIEGCTFIAPKSGGVHISDGVFELRVDGCWAIGAGYAVLADDPSSGGEWSFTNNTFRGGSSGDGIELNCPTTGISGVTISNNRVSGYTSPSQNGGFGIAVANVSNCIISMNRVSTCGRNGIHLDFDCTKTLVTSNVVHSCDDAGIEVQPNNVAAVTATGITIANNEVYNCCLAPTVSPTGLGLGGIQVGWDNGGTALVNGCLVSGNIVHSNAAAGIESYRPGSTLFHGNACYNNAGPGIKIRHPAGALISANRCYDDQAVKTQTYGIVLSNDGTDGLVSGNLLAGNLTGALSNTTSPAIGT